MSDVAGVIERQDGQTFIDQAMRMIEDAAVSGGDIEPMVVNQLALAGAFSDLLSSLSARIAELERERDEAVKLNSKYAWQRDNARHERGEAEQRADAYKTGAEIALAKLAKAEEALKPFADYCDELNGFLDNHNQPLPDDDGPGWVYVKVGDFRRARDVLAALSPMPNKEG